MSLIYWSFVQIPLYPISPNHQIWPWTILVFNMAMDHHLLALAMGVNQIIKLFGDHLQQSFVDVVWFILLYPSVLFFCPSQLTYCSTVLVASKDRIKSTWMIRRTWTSQALDRCRSERIARKKMWWFSVPESEQSGSSCLGVPKSCRFCRFFPVIRRCSKLPPLTLKTDNRSYVYQWSRTLLIKLTQI